MITEQQNDAAILVAAPGKRHPRTDMMSSGATVVPSTIGGAPKPLPNASRGHLEW